LTSVVLWVSCRALTVCRFSAKICPFAGA
jgi:hypothetical protein